jgi:hypothetical protein
VEFHYAECHYLEFCYAECRYEECRYAECCGTIFEAVKKYKRGAFIFVNTQAILNGAETLNITTISLTVLRVLGLIATEKMPFRKMTSSI